MPIKFDLKNPKRAASFTRYENYKLATTIKQMYELCPDVPASKITADLRYDYARGWVSFPGREPKSEKHYRVNSARRHGTRDNHIPLSFPRRHFELSGRR